MKLSKAQRYMLIKAYRSMVPFNGWYWKTANILIKKGLVTAVFKTGNKRDYIYVDVTAEGKKLAQQLVDESREKNLNVWTGKKS